MVRRTVLFLAAVSMLAAQPAVPRKAGDFIVVAPDGKTRNIADLKGDVLALCFIYTTCPHCQGMSVLMNQLYKEHSTEGFIPIDVAWNDGAKEAVPAFVQRFNLYMPVGYSDRTTVLGYLGISLMDQRIVVPQILWIDRKGMIRSQTPPTGDLNMLSEQYFRKMVTTLLAEPGPAAPHRITKR